MILTLVTCEVCDYRAALALHPCRPTLRCSCWDDEPVPCVKAPPIVEQRDTSFGPPVSATGRSDG